MTESFFAGAQRRVTIGSITKQCSNGRIVFPVQMPLTDDLRLPDWVSEGYEAVSKKFTEVNPEIEQIADIAVAFWGEQSKTELFEVPSAKISNAELKCFKILRVGESDEPDVELHFKVYASFARELWEWLGEMSGKEVFMAFPSTLGTKSAESGSEQMPLEHETPKSPVAAAPPLPKPTALPKRKSGGPKELAEHVLGSERPN